MATRPKEMVKEPMERMAMRGTFSTDGGRTRCSLSGFTSEGFRKALFRRENIMPPVPGFFQARQHISQREMARLGGFQLLPGERHGNRCARHAAGRVGHVQCLTTHVHVVVDENFPCALLRGPL